MFKGIFNVYSENLQNSAVKIISMVSKNRAHQTYLILNIGGFAKIFHKTPEIFTLKASRYGNFCGGSCSQANVHRLRRQALQAHSRELRRSQPLQNSRCRESITFPTTEIFPLRCREYRKRRCRRCGVA